MDHLSVFDIFKIGVGPSSSHTMGPWTAARRFLSQDVGASRVKAVTQVIVSLYGSLAKTGRGHGTGFAVMMGLRDEDPATCDTGAIQQRATAIRAEKHIDLMGHHTIAFDPAQDIIYHLDQTLDDHPNGMSLTAYLDNDTQISATYFSVGGGFVVRQGEVEQTSTITPPFACDCADDIKAHCKQDNVKIWQMVYENELAYHTPEAINAFSDRIWAAMQESVYTGCHTPGVLPGGLNVIRRGSQLHRDLIGDAQYDDIDSWMAQIRAHAPDFETTLKWISCFALAVNEQNAAFGRIVTAPTNGAAGVIPAVLMYYVVFRGASAEDVRRFLLVAGQIGILFKNGATISAAMGGCQAEIGVSSSMAAAALTECLGGSVDQALMAAEIAMEHHLGMTCDPVGGLVQIPCIERNVMGAMKAITASTLALASKPNDARVSLDDVIKAMWDTARDMSHKYKETSEGGLATHIPVSVIEC